MSETMTYMCEIRGGTSKAETCTISFEMDWIYLVEPSDALVCSRAISRTTNVNRGREKLNLT
jgi:hypothetical protein